MSHFGSSQATIEWTRSSEPGPDHIISKSTASRSVESNQIPQTITRKDVLYLVIRLYLYQNGKPVKPGDEISRVTIGGSEVGSLLNQNKYKSRQELLQDKVDAHRGRLTFDPPIPCIWGIMLEPVAKLLTEALFGMRIIADNISVVNHERRLRYTADGLGVVFTNAKGNLCYKNSPVEERRFVHKAIYEFKCPYRRTFKYDIPMYYKLQAQLGLRVLQPFDFVVFVEYIFRICAIGDLGSSPIYNTEYHGYRSIYTNNALAWGKFEVYAPQGTKIEQQMDFGSMKTYGFNKMMKMVGAGKCIVKLVSLTIGDNTVIDKLPIIDTVGKVLVGIIPFKAMGRRCQKITLINYHCMNTLDTNIKKFFEDLQNVLNPI